LETRRLGDISYAAGRPSIASSDPRQVGFH
jgi:hypothetical protein